MAARTTVDRASALLGRPTETPSPDRQARRAGNTGGLTFGSRPTPGKHPGGRGRLLAAADLQPVIDWFAAQRTIADTAATFDVCRATIYKWLAVLADGGWRICSDKPRRPRSYWIERAAEEPDPAG